MNAATRAAIGGIATGMPQHISGADLDQLPHWRAVTRRQPHRPAVRPTRIADISVDEQRNSLSPRLESPILKNLPESRVPSPVTETRRQGRRASLPDLCEWTAVKEKGRKV